MPTISNGYSREAGMWTFKMYRFNNYKGTAALVIINNEYSKETTLIEIYRLVMKVERTTG